MSCLIEFVADVDIDQSYATDPLEYLDGFFKFQNRGGACALVVADGFIHDGNKAE